MNYQTDLTDKLDLSENIISTHGNWVVRIDRLSHLSGKEEDYQIIRPDLFALRLASRVGFGWVFAALIKIAKMGFVDGRELVDFNLAFFDVLMANYFLERVDFQTDISIIETLHEQQEAFVNKIAQADVVVLRENRNRNKNNSAYKMHANQLLKNRFIGGTK